MQTLPNLTPFSDLLLKNIFNAMPGSSVLLDVDAPRFTVLALTDGAEALGGITRHQLVGRGLFESFCENPDDPTANGAQNGIASLQQVLLEKKEQHLPMQRYDLEDGNGGFIEQYWSITNRPVLNDAGEVQYIIHTSSNISSEILAERMQRQVKSMAQVNNIFLETPVAIAILKGPEFRVELANQSILAVWGKGADVLGKPITEVLPEIEEQGFVELMQKVVHENSTFHAYEMPVELVRNGKRETVYFNFSYQPYHEQPNAAPQGIIIFASEVTGEVKTRKELALKEKSLELAIEIGELGVFEVDITSADLMQCKAIYSSRVAEWFGLAPGLATLGEIAGGIFPEDQEYVFSKLNDTIAGADNGKHDLTYRTGKPGEKLRYLRSIGQVKFAGNIALSISGIIQDVTEQVNAFEMRRESEERIRNIVESTPFPIGVYIGRELEIAFANQAIIDIYGKGNDVIGKSYHEILPELESQQIFEQINSVFETGQPFFANTSRIDIEREGIMQTSYFNYNFIPLQDRQGKVYGILNTGADVTEIVLAKQKVEENEKTFRNLIEQTPVAIDIMMGPDWILEMINPPMEELIGRPRAELLHRPLFEALPELRNNGLEEILKQVYHTGNRFEAKEYAIPLNRKGTMQTAYVNFMYEPLKNAEGGVIGVIAAAIDVTEQVIARKKIEESEARFQNLVREASAAIVVLTGEEMKVEIVNEAYARLLDRKPEDILHKPLFSIIPEAASYYLPLLLQVKNTGQPVHLYDSPYSFNKDGRQLEGFLHVTYQPYRDLDGNILGVMAILQDVTEQVQATNKLAESERHLELLSNTVPAMIFYLDKEERYRSYNNTFMDWWGVGKTEVIGKTVQELIGHIAYQNVKPYLEQAFEGHQVKYEMQAPARIGGHRYLSIVYTPHRNMEGEVLGLIVHATDITDRMLAQQKIEEEVVLRTRELAEANIALAEANRELKRSNQNLEEFAYAASHDLKEPIRKIHFFTSHLKGQLEAHLDENKQQSFDRIEKATMRMGSLIDDLLLYSHVSQRPHEKEMVDLNLTLQHVLEDLELDIQEKHAEIHVHSLPVVMGYRRQLQQLFQNLLTNALKYSRENQPPVVSVNSSTTEENGVEFYQVVVSDNGIGIEPEYREKIFKMFTRLHGKNEYSGTGVGLSIVKKIVENSNGRIYVEASENGGSRFVVLLPKN